MITVLVIMLGAAVIMLWHAWEASGILMAGKVPLVELGIMMRASVVVTALGIVIQVVNATRR